VNDAGKIGGEPYGRRARTAALILVTLATSWYGMMLVHELGHVLHAVVSGGEVLRVVWRPDAFSRTELGRNPSPAWVVWGGPAWGVAIPLAVLGAWRALRLRHLFLWRFFAGFCLVANGAYMGAGAFAPAGDTEDLLALGTPAWVLAAVGIPMAGAGLLLWNGLGRCFGLGAAGPVGDGPLAAAAWAAVILGALMTAHNLR
jgi:hypothetical protein